jgi:hypothetical protein
MADNCLQSDVNGGKVVAKRRAKPRPEQSVEKEAQLLRERLNEIAEYAHEHSTGPAVPDSLWEIRRMAYETIGGEL